MRKIIDCQAPQPACQEIGSRPVIKMICGSRHSDRFDLNGSCVGRSGACGEKACCVVLHEGVALKIRRNHQNIRVLIVRMSV